MTIRPSIVTARRNDVHDTIPNWLVARVTPELSRSCRLALDLPILGMLTWLCGGAHKPRRSIGTVDLWRRLAQAFPHLGATPRQQGAALHRLWRAGLVRVTGSGWWQPVWHEDATVCRLDVALWNRQDLSAAAKRVHALTGHRWAAGRSDAACFLGSVAGMSRGRIGAAVRELAAAGIIQPAGRRRGTRGTWRAWSTTGTQPEGVPKPFLPNNPTAPTGAASPMNRRPYQNGSANTRPGTVVWWEARVRQAWLGSIEQVLDAAGFGQFENGITRTGQAGLARWRASCAARIECRGTSAGTVAAWLLEHVARGLTPERACAALGASLGGIELDRFVAQSCAERHLPDGPHLARVHDLVDSVAGATQPVGLRVAAPCVTSGLAWRLETELAAWDREWNRAGRSSLEARYFETRGWLLSRIAQCRPSETTCKRTVG